MGIAVLLIVNTAIVGFVGWIIFASDPHAGGVEGKVSRLFLKSLPSAASRSLRAVCGERLYGKLQKLYNYVVYQPNPILQIFYLVLVNGGFLAFILEAYPYIPTDHFDRIHRPIVFIAMALCAVSFAVACTVGPGRITLRSVPALDNYPIDGVIFRITPTPAMCSTCNVPKLARSKHCSTCGICVSRFDHHCAWLNQCVGEQNYRVFLLFLLVHCAMLWYGTALLVSILMTETRERRLWSARFHNANTGVYSEASLWVIVSYLIYHKGRIFALLVLSGVMGLVISLFTLYHFYLIARGQTTNESFKWKDARKFYKRLIAAWNTERDRIEKEKRNGLTPVVLPSPKHKHNDVVDAQQPNGAVGSGGNSNSEENDTLISPAEKDKGEEGREYLRRRSRRPQEGRTLSNCSSVTNGGSASKVDTPKAKSIPSSGNVQSTTIGEQELPDAPGKMPINIYNQGVWSNFMEVLFPRCYRKRNRKLELRDAFSSAYSPYWLDEEEDTQSSEKVVQQAADS